MAACLNHEDRYNSNFAKFASWRWPLFKASVILPLIFSSVECFFNKYRLLYKHAFLVLVLALGYVVVNYGADRFLSKSQLYPNLTVWNLNKETTPDKKEGHNYWTDLGMFIVIWLTGTTLLSFLWTFLHTKKMVKESEKQNSHVSVESVEMNNLS